MTLQTYPDNTQASITYDDLNNFLTVTDQNGTSIRKEYDKLGNHVRDVEVEFGSVLIFNEYDNMMRLIRSVNADGSSKTENVYAVDGRLSSKIIKDTWNTTVYRENYAYDDAYANGTYAKVTKTIPGETGAPEIVTVEYHDPYGRKAKDGYVSGGVEYLNNYFYDYTGNMIQTVSARHTAEGWQEPYTQKFEYDYAGRTVKAYDIEGNYTTTEYDSIGRKIKVTDPAGNVATNTYAALFEYEPPRIP